MPQREANDLAPTIASVPELIAICTGTAFLLSAVHTLGLSIGFDIYILTYFSVSDYLNNAVGWLLPVALVAVLSVGLGVLLQRGIRVRTARRGFSKKNSLKRLILFRNVSMITSAAIAMTLLLTLFLARPPLSDMYFGLGLLSVSLYSWCFLFAYISQCKTRKMLAIREAARVFLFLLVIPVFAQATFFLGMGEGRLPTDVAMRPYQIVLSDNTELSVRYSIFLERLIIAKLPDGGVQIIPISETKRIIKK
jgi:hypothetical protein